MISLVGRTGILSSAFGHLARGSALSAWISNGALLSSLVLGLDGTSGGLPSSGCSLVTFAWRVGLACLDDGLRLIWCDMIVFGM